MKKQEYGSNVSESVTRYDRGFCGFFFFLRDVDEAAFLCGELVGMRRETSKFPSQVLSLGFTQPTQQINSHHKTDISM